MNKVQEADVEDRRYNIGEISEVTGLQKTTNGWVKPKNGKQPEAKKEGSEAIRERGGQEIKGNLEAAKYYFDKAQSFSPTDPSYKTYMGKAKEYNDKARAQANQEGFDFEEMHNSGVTHAINKYAEGSNDSAPRVLTGDTKIRVRK